LTCFKEGVRQIPVESIPGVGEFIPLLLVVLNDGKILKIFPFSTLRVIACARAQI
jgi:hypothetical protein